MSINAIRRLLYRLAALLGDVQAVRRDPAAIAKRLVRKRVWRVTGKRPRHHGK
jgi:hypothetical protein